MRRLDRGMLRRVRRKRLLMRGGRGGRVASGGWDLLKESRRIRGHAPRCLETGGLLLEDEELLLHDVELLLEGGQLVLLVRGELLRGLHLLELQHGGL